MLFACLLTGVAVANAQPAMLSGRVLSSEKEIIDFATVYLKGTNQGGITNAEGIYHLKARAGRYTLVVSAVGYKTVEMPIELQSGQRQKQNITLTASFVATNYKVTFEANGGNFQAEATTETTASYGGTIPADFTVPVPTREGSNFLGWMRTGDPTRYTSEEVKQLAITGDTVFIAVWSGDVQVNFNANGGTITSGTDFLTGQSGSAMTGLPEVSRTGYEFTGWYTDAACQTSAGSGGSYTFPADSAIWYAGWRAKTVTITFDYNGGKVGDKDSSTLERAYNGTVVGSTAELPTPSKTGWRLVGWTNNDGLMVPTEKMPEQLVTNADGMTFTAYYEENMVTLTFQAGDGAQFPDSSSSMTYTRAEGSEMDLSSVPVPIKTNNDFVGWKLQGTDDNTAQKAGKVPFSQSQTYVAVWKDAQYTITFRLNGGSVDGRPGDVVENLSHGNTFPDIPDVTLSGNTLQGWMNMEDGQMYGDTNTAFPATVTESATYIAIWGTNTYDVTFTKYDYSDQSTGDRSSLTIPTIYEGIPAAPTVTRSPPRAAASR